MSNSSSENPVGPLSIGNVVSAGIRIYRSHLKRYLTLSFTAALWSIVPVYGWAKASEIGALISRLAFSELMGKPETTIEARKHTRPRLWNFLGVAVLLFLIFLGLLIAILFVGGIFVGVGAIVASQGGAIGVGLFTLLLIVAFIGTAFVWIRLASRLFLAEVPLVIEENLDATSSISRSWNLTKGSVGRIQWIFIVAVLLSLVIYIPSQLILSLFTVLAGALSTTSGTSGIPASVQVLLQILNFGLSLVTSALILPYWQSIKAVIYYDLRTRKEGLGLQLRDSSQEDW